MKKSTQFAAVALVLGFAHVALAIGPTDLPKDHPGYVSRAQLEASRLSSPLILAEKAWERFYLSEGKIYDVIVAEIPGPKPRGLDGYNPDFSVQPRSRTMQQALTDLSDVLIAEKRAIDSGQDYFEYKGKKIMTNRLVYEERLRAFKAAKEDLKRLMQSMGTAEARTVYRLVSDQVAYQNSKSMFAIFGFDPKKALAPMSEADKDMVPLLLARAKNNQFLKPTNVVLGLAVAAVGVTSMMGSDSASAAAPSVRPAHMVKIPVEQPEEESVQEGSDRN